MDGDVPGKPRVFQGLLFAGELSQKEVIERRDTFRRKYAAHLKRLLRHSPELRLRGFAYSSFSCYLTSMLAQRHDSLAGFIAYVRAGGELWNREEAYAAWVYRLIPIAQLHAFPVRVSTRPVRLTKRK